MAAFQPSDVRIGPCSVTFDSVDLGGTMGGVKVKLDPKFTDLKVDQFGDTPVDSVLTGQEYTVETELAASSDKDIMMIAMPYATEVTSGSNTKLVIENKTGTQMNQFAKTLTLHPLAKAANDKSEDLTFHKAFVKSTVEFEYGPTKQRGIKVTWTVIPDTSVTPARYLTIGDPAITSA